MAAPLPVIARLEAEFLDAFEACEWEALDPLHDCEVLEYAVPTRGGRALREADGRTAVRAYSRLDEARRRAGIPTSYNLALAHVLDGDLVEGRRLLADGARDCRRADRTEWMIVLGDLEAAAGEYEAASRCWTEAAEVATSALGTLRGPPRGLALRRAVVNKQRFRPVIDRWVGDPSAHENFRRGDVRVVVLFDPRAPVGAEFEPWPRPVSFHPPFPSVFLLTPRVGSVRLPGESGQDLGDRTAIVPSEGFESSVASYQHAWSVPWPIGVAERVDLGEAGARPEYLPVSLVLDSAGVVAYLDDARTKNVLLRLAVARLRH